MNGDRPPIRVEMTPGMIAVWARVKQIVQEFPFLEAIHSVKRRPGSGCGKCGGTRTSTSVSTQPVNLMKLEFLRLPHSQQVKLLTLCGYDELVVAGYDLRGKYYKEVIRKEG